MTLFRENLWAKIHSILTWKNGKALDLERVWEEEGSYALLPGLGAFQIFIKKFIILSRNNIILLVIYVEYTIIIGKSFIFIITNEKERRYQVLMPENEYA